ncbi:unnamed protein product [Oncorhynchus mykiss]|uniref:Histone-lysine N-methyltransferase PRDM9-like n=1 Tax=Oncorhynchus mykiss TaxID=8022 RepID=A0A060YN56_ONCMY|nr:unnamed protein product [Oncorhynchus mykiss]
MSEEVIIVEWAETGASEEGCQAQLITDNASAVLPDSLVQNILVNTVVQGQEEDHELLDDNSNDLYCEECHSSYKDQCDIQGSLSFMLDSPSPVGLPQRALLTLPHGLVVGRSSIPGAGLGVLNQGAIVAPGMHFGPCEGEVTTRDKAVTSDYSWEVWNSKGESEYIDSARDTHSNWMRYVNCARNEEEGNLIALQYRGIVFFHCCRSILPGDELLFWPGGRFIDRFRDPSDQIWLRKSTPSEVNTNVSSQVFLCCQCKLSFTTETYIQRHQEQLHPLDLSPASALSELENHLSKTVHSNVRPYCCPLCRKCFAQGYDLESHQLRDHGRKKKPGVKRFHSDANPDALDMEGERREAVGEAQYSCSDCQRTFGNPESLKAHQCIRVMVGPPLYSCSTCSVTFKQYTTLKKHKVNKHPKENMLYCCTHCGRFFSQAAGLQHHLDAEQKAGEVHLCLQCGQSYEHVQSFKAHRCFQSDAAKLHLCNDCGKGFSCFYSLKQHQRIHTGEKPYRCSYCEKCFSHSGHLNVHVRIHTGEKSFLCTECGESFRQSGDLKRHERKHTGVKPCTCPECGKSFSRPQSLKAHLMLHNGERQYKCDQCGKSFSRNYHLTRHHEKTHS